MTIDHEHEPQAHGEPNTTQVVRETGGGLTSYAAVKYGFMLAITIVILYFLARFILPMFR